MPNMSRARVRGTVNNTTGDLYVSSDEEDMNYITGQRLSTRTGKLLAHLIKTTTEILQCYNKALTFMTVQMLILLFDIKLKQHSWFIFPLLS